VHERRSHLFVVRYVRGERPAAHRFFAFGARPRRSARGNSTSRSQRPG
jgi:hypothetical protein